MSESKDPVGYFQRKFAIVVPGGSGYYQSSNGAGSDGIDMLGG